MAEPAPSVAVAEPPPSLVDAVLASGGASATVTLPPVETPASAAHAETAPVPVSASLANARAAAPRLERLSRGEVALVTRSQPVWTARVVNRTDRSATVRFVPVHPVARLLNAARNQGLAARTRTHLADLGWTPIQIGDAPAVRDKTLVLYPSAQLPRAKRLAAEFGFTQLRPFEGPAIVVLLGRDAARLPSLRRA